MKTFLKVLAGLAVVIVLALGAAFFATSGMTRQAEEFFEAVKADDYTAAWSYLSEDFKAGTTEQELVEFLQSGGFADIREVDWGNRSFSGKIGQIQGTIITTEGGAIPVTLVMVKGDDGWRIQRIERPAAGIREVGASRAVPPESDLIELVRDTTGAFVQAVKERSMQHFYDQISLTWQQQTTVQELDEIFGNAFDFTGDLGVLDTLIPSFDTEPAINQDGVLVVTGHYPTDPQTYFFEYKYVREGLSWKLLGFSYSIR